MISYVDLPSRSATTISCPAKRSRANWYEPPAACIVPHGLNMPGMR